MDFVSWVIDQSNLGLQSHRASAAAEPFVPSQAWSSMEVVAKWFLQAPPGRHGCLQLGWGYPGKASYSPRHSL